MFLNVTSTLRKKLLNLWSPRKFSNRRYHLYLVSPGSIYLGCTISNPEKKNGTNKYDIIIFLIIELGTTKENCGICMEMPRPFPIKSAVLCFLFFILNLFVTFLACEAFPYNRRKPQHIPNATATQQLRRAQRAGPGDCSLSQKSYKVGGVRKLLGFCIFLVYSTCQGQFFFLHIPFT